jgi:Uma2 family endonuclease
MTATASPKMSPAEYLSWEREQPERHQYIDGEIFAMAGEARDTTS